MSKSSNAAQRLASRISASASLQTRSRICFFRKSAASALKRVTRKSPSPASTFSESPSIVDTGDGTELDGIACPTTLANSAPAVGASCALI
ncbi:MAG: hypothetical protein F9K40_10535 [Kofleriaceae bacterium]|nr:MAG: hypothetical protein F9K40_10535 [Kofleriaceae bacterium]